MKSESAADLGVVLGLGSNLGSRAMLIGMAARALADYSGQSLSISSLYVTPPVGPPQPDYLNAAVFGRLPFHDERLLEPVQAVEELLCRQRTLRWGPRTVDVDVLWSAQGPLCSSRLQVPHPHLSERGFALGPMLEVTPQLSALYAATLDELGGPPPTLAPPALLREGASVSVRGSDGPDLLSTFATWWLTGVDGLLPSAGLIRPVCQGTWRALSWDATPEGGDLGGAFERLLALRAAAGQEFPTMAPRGAVVLSTAGPRWDGSLLLGPRAQSDENPAVLPLPERVSMGETASGAIELHATLCRPA